MSIFQVIMLAAAAFFGYQVYMHIQNIDEEAEPESIKEVEEEVVDLAPSFDDRVKEADEAYMDDNVDKAKELLEGIVKDYPSTAEGMNKLAFILSKKGENEEALLYYRASLRIDENDDMAHNAIARLLSTMNKSIEAEEHYELAIKIDDNYEMTWFNYANLMLSLGKKEEAKKMFQKALEIDPSFEDAKKELEALK
ncbi:MAG TPA: tetratricopeptide repeat protein [Sulfurimonas sp.]|nr:tetratricopeptide repeat protein [Sulfurimonas sp.]